MLLQLSTWMEVESYLQESQGIIIPIGSTEQHGPTGLIGTDAITADAIAQAVGERNNALVAPVINVGMALHHGSFPGTITLRPTTLINLVSDWIFSLAKAGFTHFYFINGHGGNIATLKAAFSEVYDRIENSRSTDSKGLRCTTANWFMCSSVYKLAKELYGENEGSHATPSEVAVTQYLYPEAIKTAPLSPKVNRDRRIYSAGDFRQRYPDGRMGSLPSLATPSHGEQFFNLAVTELSENYLKFLQD